MWGWEMSSCTPLPLSTPQEKASTSKVNSENTSPSKHFLEKSFVVKSAWETISYISFGRVAVHISIFIALSFLQQRKMIYLCLIQSLPSQCDWRTLFYSRDPSATKLGLHWHPFREPWPSIVKRSSWRNLCSS